MTVKEELHRLIDELPEGQAGQAKALLKGLREDSERLSSASETMDADEWERFVDGFALDLGHDAPILSDEALRREHLYDDRGL